MQIKSFFLGVLVGALLAGGASLLFGDLIRGEVATTTEGLGQKVQRVGEKLERTGEHLR